MENKKPKRLHNDAIIEAVCEVKFETEQVPEIVIGRLSDHWSDHETARLPTSDIPQAIRTQNKHFKYAPVVEIRDPEGNYNIKIGSSVISFHNIGSYFGWDVLSIKLQEVIEVLFEKVPGLVVSRVGLRYTNALNSELHGIHSIYELNYDITVDGDKVVNPSNLNYMERCDDTHFAMTRIASLEFVEGKLPEGSIGVVDIDISTPPNFQSSSDKEIIKWISSAHDYEGSAFFKLIPPDLLMKLVAEWE